MGNARVRRIALGAALFVLLEVAVSAAAPQAQTAMLQEFNAPDPRLEQCIRQALDRNPSVRQSFAGYQAALARIPQAGALPDPKVGITQFLRAPETRVGPQTTSLSLSQQIPWFGKLNDKEGVAAKEAAIAREQYEAGRDEIIRQVKLAFYDLGYIDRAIAITNEDLSLLRHYEILAQARYGQGIGLQQAVVKLQAEITRDLNRLEQLRARRVDAEAVLNALRDLPADTPVPTVSQGSMPKPGIQSDELLRIGRENRPEVRASLLQIERDEKRIQLAHRNYWPDFTISGGFTNVRGRTDPAGILNPPDQNGKNIFSFSIGVNIPIGRKKYDAAVAEATEDKIASRENYRALVNSMEAGVRALGFRIQTLGEQISLYEHTLLPQAQQALASTEAAYSTGTLGVLELLDSERVLLDVRLGSAQLTGDYMKALAEMERIVGAPF